MWRQNHYRAAVETALDAILVVSDSGIIQSVNPATTRIFGYQPDALMGQHISLLILADRTGSQGAAAAGPGRRDGSASSAPA